MTSSDEGTLGMSSNRAVADLQLAHDRLQAEVENLERLLTGAITSVLELTNDEENLGPAVRDWWHKQPGYASERARKILLELPDSDIEVLNRFIALHGSLPARSS